MIDRRSFLRGVRLCGLKGELLGNPMNFRTQNHLEIPRMAQHCQAEFAFQSSRGLYTWPIIGMLRYFPIGQ